MSFVRGSLAVALVVAVAALSGCGGETHGGKATDAPPETPGHEAITPKSGTRIELRGWSAGGHALGATGIWDGDKEVACHLGIAEDGKHRCLPSTFPSEGGGLVLFRDAECTRPIFAQSDQPCSEALLYGAYSVREGDAACPEERIRVVQRGAPIEGPTEVFEWHGSCSPYVAEEGAHYFESVPSAAEEWASFELHVTPVTADLAVETWTSADGSRLIGDLRLLPDDVVCESLDVYGQPYGDLHGTFRCIPRDRASPRPGYFVDGECAVPLEAAPTCKPPHVIDDSSLGQFACEPPRVRAYFELGKEFTKRDIHRAEGGSCVLVPQASLNSELYFAKGAALEIGTFPELVLRPFGDGPLQAMVWHTADGLPLVPPSPYWVYAYDPGEDTECSPTLLEDGHLRCVHSTATIRDRFADAACTEPLAERSTPGCSRPGPPPKWASVQLDACASSHIEFRIVTELHAGPLYAFMPDGTCRLGDRVSQEYYRVGPPVDPAEVFVEVVEATL